MKSSQESNAKVRAMKKRLEPPGTTKQEADGRRPHFKDQIRETTGPTTQACSTTAGSNPSSVLDTANPLLSADLVEEPPSAQTVYQAEAVDQTKEKRQRRCVWTLGALVAVLVICGISGGVGAYFALKDQSSPMLLRASAAPSANPSASFTTSPTLVQTTSPTVSRASQIEAIVLDASGSLPSEGSPQAQALDWLVTVDQTDAAIPLLPRERLISRYALATLFYAASGAGWSSQANFLSTSRHECDWSIGTMGIACDSMLRITTVSFINNGLGGTLPVEIGLLSSLEILNLRGDVDDRSLVNVNSNTIRGSIPTHLGELTNLIQLDLSRNGGFLGTIPTEIARLNALVELRLNDNQLTGLIPDFIGDLEALTLVDLSNNDLRGAAPMTLGGLRCVLLGGNNLTECYFRRERLLQASGDRTAEGCFSFTPPCGLPS